MDSKRAVIGMDLGGTKLAAALFMVTGGGAVEFKAALDNLYYQERFSGSGGSKITPEGKSKLIEQAMLDAIENLRPSAEGAALDAVGIATAGFIEDGQVIEAWNIGMKNYPLKNRMRISSGIDTYLYKDSWAPIYAVSPSEPSIIFSIGTGFGGVSCGSDLRVCVRSYSARKKVKWIPCLYFSDDPAYAASFSDSDCADVLTAVLSTRESALPSGGKTFSALVEELAAKSREFAKETCKLTPSKVELFFARALAARAAARIRADEIFADALCAAIYPVKLFSWIYGGEPSPAEMDKMAQAGDSRAQLCFAAQAGFIGRVLALMQKELLDRNLPPATRICGTGSGFNAANAGFLAPAILNAAKSSAETLALKIPQVEKIELVTYDSGDTTLACYGAAVGAARGIVQD